MRIEMIGESLPRWACLTDLILEERGGEQRVIAVPVRAGDAEGERHLRALLTFIGGYLERQPRRIIAGQTMYYGWAQLRFRESYQSDDGLGAGKLVIQETQEPLHDTSTTFVDGAASATALLAAQEAAIRRNGIAGDAEFPHRNSLAIVCTRLEPTAREWPKTLFMQRNSLSKREQHDSGWFIGCTENEHDHNDPTALGRIHLAHLVARTPRLFPYLGMPVRTSILLEPTRTVLFRPGDDIGQVESAPPFTGLG